MFSWALFQRALGALGPSPLWTATSMMSKSVDEPAQSSALLKVVALGTLCILIRLLLLVSWARPKGRKRTPGRDTCSLAIFLGSGGHTSEMMQLVCALPTNRYHSRTYIVSKGDRFSMDKALAYEKSITDPKRTFRFVRLPRARSVHQRWLTTPLSVVVALAVSVYHLVLCPLLLDRKNARIPDAILMNGPGTCVPIVAAVYLLRVSVGEAEKQAYTAVA